MTTMDPIIIIGSGLAGYTLVRELRRCDKERDILMITQQDGHFYSKPMLSTALAKQQTAEQLVMKTADEMASAHGITVLARVQVESLDTQNKQVKCSNGETYAYSACVLALGADPIRVPFSGDAVDQLVSVNHLSDYANFREWLQGKKHIAVLGSGLVGCEFMNDLVTAGHTVSVISRDQYPLQRLIPDSNMGEEIKAVYQNDWNVNWYLDQSAQDINVHGTDQIQVTLKDGKNVVVDGVLSAVGLKANMTLAMEAGLEVNRGVVVNEYHETSQPQVYALGDCAECQGELRQYVAPIMHSSRALAKTLTGELTAVTYPSMPVVIKTTQCPVVSQMPDDVDERAQWQVEGQAPHQQALLKCDGQLLGFVLMGDATKQRQALLKQLGSAV